MGKLYPTWGQMGERVVSERVDGNGTSFTLTTSDGRDVRIHLQEPLNEYVSGLTEVTGDVTQQNTIQCQHYITFPQETTDTFDLELYNTAVELSGNMPQNYIVGIEPQS
ncbi:hypothetical protein FSP39_017395 [Pinctada imbricata]|uniref:Uncharacterized protein n=1 Tax=Pinctada imbricata TaxID=66713 RepID=A0AA88YXH3_PINIB|nr:hypothetical protein FSP39_017395 [Pinctada imbricata]